MSERVAIKRDDTTEPEIAFSKVLDGAGIEGRWLDDEFEVTWVRGGHVLAGVALSPDHLKAMAALLNAALKDRGIK